MKRGFTLLELLIVIGILAILATAAVLVLNPAEFMRRARDSTRAADLTALHKSLGIYLSTIKTPNMDNNLGHCKGGTGTQQVYSYLDGATSSLTTFPYVSGVAYPGNVHGSSSRAVDGNGWLPVNLTGMANGSPLSRFPVDPLNATSTSSSTTFVYIYGCDDAQDSWVITARMESSKFNQELATPSKDGGPDDSLFEVGNAVGLKII